jgi:pimeloyl-ACP methyl ester carboxylesterase
MRIMMLEHRSMPEMWGEFWKTWVRASGWGLPEPARWTMPDVPKMSDLPSWSGANPWEAAWEYWIDACQRAILFWDVMRQRGNQYYAQKAKDVPHVLVFEGELVLDGRTFDRPVNYGLVHVTPPKGVVIDPKKRPFVVMDPRAGHGPGIGGFKADSELGVAMRAGHDSYIVGFTPDPVPGQTIEDIMRAEAIFLERVIDRHPEAEGKPCVIGNCQAGWAVMMLAATRPELFGPIIVAGSPLSYWAGIEGKNPMRYTGGLLGGSWMTAMAGDLGNGTFNGAHLVTNFDNLNPANTLWTKNYNVWAKVDTEGPRFLGFEKWWGGHVNLNAEEMQWIVDELFVGNRLATAEIVTSDGQRIDLRNIRSPIVCFCSKGDNITPPEQALGWICDLYASDKDIAAQAQTIVYAVHEQIGHLGIFVSGSVARKEHDEFASNIDLIEVLPPGLYEAVLTRKTPDTINPELLSGDWIVRFEPRTLNDVRAIVRPDPENERRFATARRVSEINLNLYRSLLQPFVQAAATRETAEWLAKLHPAELPFASFSDRNPIMRQIAELAEQVRRQRRPASPDNPLLRMQAMVSDSIIQMLESWGDLRDQSLERLFLTVYSNPLLQALMGIRASDGSPRRRPGMERERADFIQRRIAEIRAGIAEGGLREAAIRGMLYISMAGPGVDERAFNQVRQIRAQEGGLTLDEFKRVLREQFFALTLDPDGAVSAIPTMVPLEDRQKVLGALRAVTSAVGEAQGERARRLARIEEMLGQPAPASRKKDAAA